MGALFHLWQMSPDACNFKNYSAVSLVLQFSITAFTLAHIGFSVIPYYSLVKHMGSHKQSLFASIAHMEQDALHSLVRAEKHALNGIKSGLRRLSIGVGDFFHGRQPSNTSRVSPAIPPTVSERSEKESSERRTEEAN